MSQIRDLIMKHERTVTCSCGCTMLKVTKDFNEYVYCPFCGGKIEVNND